MMRSILMLFASALVLSACRESADGVSTNMPELVDAPQTLMLKKETIGNQTWTYAYSLNGKLSEAKYQTLQEPDETLFQLIYSGTTITKVIENGKLNGESIQTEYLPKYTADGKISQIDYQRKMLMNGQVVNCTGKIDLTYASGVFIIYKNILSGTVSGQPMQWTTTVGLQWNGSNLQKISVENNGNTGAVPSPSSSLSYEFSEYDDKKNPLKTLPRILQYIKASRDPLELLVENTNNYQKLSVSIGGSAITQNAEYSYNAQKYPLSQKIGSTVKTFEYY